MKILPIVASSFFFMLAGCSDSSNETASNASFQETLYVGSELVDCVGVGPMKCMQVKKSENADWTLFYNSIEGFVFEPGYEYQLVINKSVIESPAADASTEVWQLVEITKKTAVEKE